MMAPPPLASNVCPASTLGVTGPLKRKPSKISRARSPLALVTVKLLPRLVPPVLLVLLVALIGAP